MILVSGSYECIQAMEEVFPSLCFDPYLWMVFWEKRKIPVDGLALAQMNTVDADRKTSAVTSTAEGGLS